MIIVLTKYLHAGSRPSGKGKPLHWTSCLKIAEDVAAGLLHLHQSGLVHANLKPSNVLLGADFESCLTDFSLVPTFLPPSPSPSSSMPSPSSSSLFYRAPETRNSRSSNPFTPSSDVYSFGILLLELLTGKVLPSVQLLGPISPKRVSPGHLVQYSKISNIYQVTNIDN